MQQEVTKLESCKLEESSTMSASETTALGLSTLVEPNLLPKPAQNQYNFIPKRNSVLYSKSMDNDKPCAEISFKEFLDFLRTAYQINEAIDGNQKEVATNQKDLDWTEVAENKLMIKLLDIQDTMESVEANPNESSTNDQDNNSTSDSTTSVKRSPIRDPASRSKSVSDLSAGPQKPPELSKSVDQLMKRKLNELIQEGLLDSVLPYVVPKTPAAPVPPPPVKKAPLAADGKKGAAGTPGVSKDKQSAASRRKSLGESEVEIHVCDEVKNLRRDFRCPQKLLVAKMGYFAEVTTGQRLEDMDISVHCDVTIFDWLMRWVKRDEKTEDKGPQLDASNVVPILVSAAFLQMDPLLTDCLSFVRANVNDIVHVSNNLSGINDSILTRLAGMFSNSELESVKDRKDKIAGRLFCKLIVALTEPRADTKRGHYASLAGLYRCNRCGQLLSKAVAPSVPCHPSAMKMDRFGHVTSTHTRDPTWSLTDHVRQLRAELRSWRAVYWRLWGDAHFLWCSACNAPFPLRSHGWCSYHPDTPQFFSRDGNRNGQSIPVGRYPCCGERAYRFEPVGNPKGCQYREHQPELASEKENAVHTLFMKHQALISVSAPQAPQSPERITRLVRSKEMCGEELYQPLWWHGLEIAPPRPRLGLLAKWDVQQQKEDKPSAVAVLKPPGPVQEHAFRATPRVPCRQKSSQRPRQTDGSSSEDDSEDSEVSEESIHTSRSRGRRGSAAHRYFAAARSDGQHCWTGRLSTRMNQDNQRDSEERAVAKMAAHLARRTEAYARTGRNSKWSQHVVPPGGSYLRAEMEWREENCHSSMGYGARQRSVNVTPITLRTYKYRTTR